MDRNTNEKTYMDCSKQYGLLDELNIIKSPYKTKIIIAFIICNIIFWSTAIFIGTYSEDGDMSFAFALLSLGVLIVSVLNVIGGPIYILITTFNHMNYMKNNLSIQNMNNILTYNMKINSLKAPQIVINCKNLTEFQNMDSTTAIIRALNEGQATARAIISDNKQILTDTLNELDRIMTLIIENNQYVSQKYVNEIYNLLHMITYSNAGTCMIAKYQYISPAGRNNYQKSMIINYEDALDAYNNYEELLRKQKELEEQRIAMEKEQQRKENYDNKQKIINDKEEEKLKNALILFMLEMPYTKGDIKKQRNNLLKTFHSDNDANMDARYAVKINNAYEVLTKYAID